MGSSVTPAAPGASTVGTDIAEGFVGLKICHMIQQLQVRRDLINKADHTQVWVNERHPPKLLFWYRLSQGMDKRY